MLSFAEIVKHSNKSPLELVKKDSEFEYLSFVVDGGASITLENGKEVASLKKGDWISEFSFITGDKTSANVISKDIYAISWSKSKLQKIKDRKPELFEKLNSCLLYTSDAADE